MPEDADGKERQTVVSSSKFEAYFSDLLPHDSLIKGYQDAIPNGGQEVIAIVKRQQLFTFIYNMASLLTSNIIPLILILPILVAITAGAVIQITIVTSIPIGLFTASSAFDRVVTTWRSSRGDEQAPLPGSSASGGRPQLPPESGGSQP